MNVQKSQLVEMAQVFINNAIEILEKACEGDANAEAYLIDHLKIMAGSNHGFLSRDMNLDELIERYESDEIEVDSGWYERFDEMI